MKAIVVDHFGDEKVLQYKEIPTPIPNQKQIRVKIEAIGVNPVETYIRGGVYPLLPQLPYTPGNDGAGIIDMVGEDIHDFKVGDRVFVAAIISSCSGTYAEYCVCEQDAVHPLSDTLSFVEGAAFGTSGLAAGYALFNKANIQANDKVLIHGASGSVGNIAVQLAKQANAIVYGTAGDAKGMELIKTLGADYAFNHNEEHYIDDIIAVSGGCNCIIEMVGHKNLMKDTNIATKYGVIVIVGSRGIIEFDPRSLMSKNLDVRGMNLSNMKPEEYTTLLDVLTHSFENGLHLVVGEKYALKDAVQAHQLLQSDKNRNGKIILIP